MTGAPPEDSLPQSATGRTPEWVKDEAAGVESASTEWRAPSQSLIPDSGPLPGRSRPQKTSRRSFWILLGVVCASAVVVGVLAGLALSSR